MLFGKVSTKATPLNLRFFLLIVTIYSISSFLLKTLKLPANLLSETATDLVSSEPTEMHLVSSAGSYKKTTLL